jgi:chemosensory pili system protein ChpC
MTGPIGNPLNSELRGLVAATGAGDLLLPTSAVAEVVAYGGEAGSRTGEPVWLIGELKWRDRQVPLIDVVPHEVGLARAPVDRHRRPHVLVCFTPSGNRALPYVGLLVSGLPRLIRIRIDDLIPTADATARPFALCALEFQGRPAWVPDLDEVERQGLRYGLAKR